MNKIKRNIPMHVAKGEMMVDPNQQPKWSVLITYDESFNFATFVGCYYGFLTSDKHKSRVQLWPSKSNVNSEDLENFSELQKHWHNWWRELIKVRAERIVQGDGYPVSQFFNRSDFSTVSPSIFAECLSKVWPIFYEWWGMPAGGSSALAYWESIVNISKHVSKAESVLGRKLKEFRLTIDIIYTGLEDVMEINPQHVMLTPLALIDDNWWIEKFKELG